jgi:AraC-like DNA-binding protein
VFNKDVPKILETYYKATEIPIFYTDIYGHLLSQFPDIGGYQALIDFFDFKEVLEFTGSFLKCSGNRLLSPCHIFHTHNFFIYNILILNIYQNMTGVIISGPVPAYPLDEKRIEELLAQNKLPLSRKPEMELLVNCLPSISSKRMFHYGKLLFFLFESDMNNGAFPDPEIHNNWVQPKPIPRTMLNSIIDENSNKLEESYHFFESIRNKMVRGDIKGINELINNSIHILLDTNSSEDPITTLKNRYITLCSILHIFAIQSKAPYGHMVNILNELTENIKLLKTSDDILSAMISAILVHSRAVSTLVNNMYSLHVNQALHYIREHYTEKITLEALSDNANINPIYLSSLLKKETKLSLSDNINKVRIDESCNLLIQTDMSMNEIAYAVGYNYQNHFCRVFKKFKYITPMEFKRIHKNINIS